MSLSGRCYSLSNSAIVIAPEVREAIHAGAPVVALESTIISHGLPYPRNLEVALELENIGTGEIIFISTCVI